MWDSIVCFIYLFLVLSLILGERDILDLNLVLWTENSVYNLYFILHDWLFYYLQNLTENDFEKQKYDCK